MNRLFALSAVFLLLITACTANQENTSKTATLSETEEISSPVYATELKDGQYEITVDSNSSMFRVINCRLIVEKGKMNAIMTMSGQGYGMLYMGTGEEALNESKENYIPFVLNENGEKTFTVPVEALNIETDCTAWSIRKEKWYDRILVYRSDTIPKEAFSME